MSWVTNKAIIVAVLTTASYREVPRLQELEKSSSSYMNKCYTLKCVNVGLTNLSNISLHGTDLVELRIIYNNKSSSRAENAQRDTNTDTFADLCFNTIQNLSGFAGFDKDASHEDFGEYQSIWNVRFWFGYRTS